MNEADALAIDYHAIIRALPILFSGIATGELYQWCIWKSKNPDKKWRGYWIQGLPHMGMNAAIVLGCFTAWHCGALSKIIELFGGTPIAQLLAVSPPVGYLITLMADVLGDQIAYALQARFGKFFKKANSTPPETGGAPQPPIVPQEAP
jgi:hypothetical protein